MKKLRCALLGATGLAGQQFVAALASHPWFELTGLAASTRSAGKHYMEALRRPNGMSGWFLSEPLPSRIASMPVVAGDALDVGLFDIVFSAVAADVALALEPVYAQRLPVISTASAFRYGDDVPLLLPPINAEHSQLIEKQKQQRGFEGFIAPNPKGAAIGLALSLAPLVQNYGVKAVLMTSMQAISGAGRAPGVAALDILENIIPYIPKEEGKVEIETKKILGQMDTPHAMKVSCTCTRVPVLEGHTESVFVSLEKPASVEELAQTMHAWQGTEVSQKLPSAPPRWIEVMDDPFRPQVRLDRDMHAGMATIVGRIREDDVLENGFKYVLVSHNTKMGAAKGALLIAEMLYAQGRIRSSTNT
ncbi:MAG: aspartate-semialdehyde dehydrogenase [Cystobacterineae bacterium]|nr:aspartate-semialdehyde dehydrogenase [Cystobacterineae bacterium]